MDFAKVVERVRRGQKIAKIAGTVSELQQARKALGRFIDHDERLVMKLENNCLYVGKAITEPVSFVLFPLSQILRQ